MQITCVRNSNENRLEKIIICYLKLYSCMPTNDYY